MPHQWLREGAERELLPPKGVLFLLHTNELCAGPYPRRYNDQDQPALPALACLGHGWGPDRRPIESTIFVFNQLAAKTSSLSIHTFPFCFRHLLISRQLLVADLLPDRPRVAGAGCATASRERHRVVHRRGRRAAAVRHGAAGRSGACRFIEPRMASMSDSTMPCAHAA